MLRSELTFEFGMSAPVRPILLSGLARTSPEVRNGQLLPLGSRFLFGAAGSVELVRISDSGNLRTQELPGRAFPVRELPRLTGGFVEIQTISHWQNLSISVAESVILQRYRVAEVVTISHDAVENAGISHERTTDFGHFWLWPLECDSTCELVTQRIS
jgi:hypothetical protein